MNVKLLEKVIEKIESDPAHFNMDYFYVVDSIVDTINCANALPEQSRCGTTCCIAGWAYVLNGGGIETHNQGKIEVLARQYLGLTFDESEKLFYVHNWPKKYRDKFNECSSYKGEARVAINYLKAIIKRYNKDGKVGLDCN